MPAVGDLSAALVQTPVQTSAYTAKPFEFVRTDTSGGSFTVTLPLAPASNTVIGIKQVTTSGSNTTTVACSGSDVMNKYGGGTSLTLTLSGQGATVAYRSGVWLITSDDLPLAQLDTRYAALSAADFAPTGLTGAKAASRYAGATTGGAPVTGTFVTGDFVEDQTGGFWICTAAGSPGTWVQAGVNNIPPFEAPDASYLAWSFDPVACTGTITGAGNVYLSRINVRSQISCTNVVVAIANAPASLTASQNYAGLINSAGTLVGITADQSSAWSGPGTYTMALAGGPYTLSAGFYWVAALSNGVTNPTFAGGSGTSKYAVNAGFSAAGVATSATLRFGQTSGSGHTSLTAITPSANVITSGALWAAIS